MFSVFKLFSLNGLGQVFYALSSLFIVRYLPLEEYGIAACILTFTNFCASIATGRYDIAILYEKNEEKWKACIVVSFIVVCLLSSIFACLGFLLQKILFKGVVFYKNFIVLVFFLILGGSSFDLIIRKIYIYKGQFNALSYVLFVNYLLRSLLPFLLLFLWQDWKVCVVGEMLGVNISCAFFWVRQHNNIAKKLSLKNCFEVLKAYKHYPKYQLPSTIIDNVAFASIVPNLNFLFGSDIAGQFALVYRILLMPLSFFGRIMSDIYQHALRISVQYKQLVKVFYKYTIVLLLIALGIYIPSGIVLFIFYKINFFKSICDCFYLWPIIFLAFFQFIISPLSVALLINKIGVFYKFSYDIIKLVCIATCFFFTYIYRFDHICCVKILSFTLITTYTFYYFLVYHYVRHFRYTES
ncbi:MAG: hypothetical protein ACLRFH_01630 [Opitutales bacterium]